MIFDFGDFFNEKILSEFWKFCYLNFGGFIRFSVLILHSEVCISMVIS